MNKREFFKAHPPDYSPVGWLLQLLDMKRQLMKQVMESVEGNKIPPEHCNYLAGFLETKTIPLLEEIVQGLRDKAKQ